MASSSTNNNITPEYVAEAWYHTVTSAHAAQDTPLTQAFFAPSNVEWIRQKIQGMLRESLNEPNIIFILNREFAQDMINMAINNKVYSYSPHKGLAVLNSAVVKNEYDIAYLGQRAHKRYVTQMLKGDRMRIFPYGLGDRTLHARGENQVTQSPYQLNHPWKSQYQAYLSQVLKINPNACPQTETVGYNPRFPNP
jgi:hypothetical protein